MLVKRLFVFGKWSTYLKHIIWIIHVNVSLAVCELGPYCCITQEKHQGIQTSKLKLHGYITVSLIQSMLWVCLLFFYISWNANMLYTVMGKNVDHPCFLQFLIMQSNINSGVYHVTKTDRKENMECLKAVFGSTMP